METAQLDSLHQEDIKNELHPSIFFSTDYYHMAIYRLFGNFENELKVISHGFVIDKFEKVYAYDKQSRNLVLLGGYENLYEVLDKLVDQSMKKVDQMILKIENLEEDIYENLGAVKDWFGLKKDLTRMERILAQAIKVHESLMNSSNYIQNDQKLYSGFEDIEEHLNRIYRSCGINLAKLDAIYNLYSTLSNEKMNTIIYVLTVVSAIFLPLNLLVGFFGMNTEGLYFSGNPNGTLIVTSLLIFLFILFFGYAKFKRNMI